MGPRNREDTSPPGMTPAGHSSAELPAACPIAPAPAASPPSPLLPPGIGGLSPAAPWPLPGTTDVAAAAAAATVGGAVRDVPSRILLPGSCSTTFSAVVSTVWTWGWCLNLGTARRSTSSNPSRSSSASRTTGVADGGASAPPLLRRRPRERLRWWRDGGGGVSVRRRRMMAKLAAWWTRVEPLWRDSAV